MVGLLRWSYHSDQLLTPKGYDMYGGLPHNYSAKGETTEPEKIRETGMRSKLTVIFSTDNAADDYYAIRNGFHAQIAAITGGLTYALKTGVWLDDYGLALDETVAEYNVSFEPGLATQNHILDIFSEFAAACGVTWMHVEGSVFEALHVNVR